MATVLSMSMSLDGFIAGPNEGPGNGLGDGGHRLHEWCYPDRDAPRNDVLAGLTGVDAEVMGELMATGAVVAGRQTVELAGGWGGDHHDGVPIFVYSRRPPAPEAAQWPLATYLDDVAEAMARGKRGGGRQGRARARRRDRAGGIGRRRPRRAPDPPGRGAARPGPAPVRGLRPEHVELELTRVVEGPESPTSAIASDGEAARRRGRHGPPGPCRPPRLPSSRAR